MNNALLSVTALTKHFDVRGGVLLRKIGTVHAVDEVSLDVAPRETLGLVGESGCGKSTLGRAILMLDRPTAGSVIFDGHDLNQLPRRQLRAMRQHMQMVFQDPFESLNSRMTVSQILNEPFVIHRVGTNAERRNRVAELLTRVGLSPSMASRFPHEFSGGQRQRIGIARAIALRPKLLVCDEAVSALDVSVQAQIVNLLLELQREMGIAMLFIAHDLAVVKHVSDRVAVMYLGRIVEVAPSQQLYLRPRHPYTQALITAIPVPEPPADHLHRERPVISGEVPSPINPPQGCRFHTRCPHAIDKCKTHTPPLEASDADSSVACWRWRELSAAAPSANATSA